MAFWPAFATGALSFLGGERRNRAAAELAAQSTATNIAEAQKDRDWQERMANTAHRRAMADLRAAGLNPILAAQQGAPTGSGAQASAVTADVSDVLTPAVSSAMQARQLSQNLKQSAATIDLTKQNEKLAWQDTNKRNAEVNILGYEEMIAHDRSKMSDIELEAKKETLKQLKALTAGIKNQEQFEQSFPMVSQILKILMGVGSTAADVATMGKTPTFKGAPAR
jgi:hypothetical protein